jgi:hypothetical protein
MFDERIGWDYTVRFTRPAGARHGRDLPELVLTRPGSLSHAESGGVHLTSNCGYPVEILRRPTENADWQPLTCAVCGVSLRFINHWYHDPDGVGPVPRPNTREEWSSLVDGSLWCAGTIPGTSKAIPVRPVTCPRTFTPQETLLALTERAGAEDSPRIGERVSFDWLIRDHLNDRYQELQGSGRIFGVENEETREQYVAERSYAGNLFNGYAARIGRHPGISGAGAVMLRADFQELATAAARQATDAYGYLAA